MYIDMYVCIWCINIYIYVNKCFLYADECIYKCKKTGKQRDKKLKKKQQSSKAEKQKEENQEYTET
jgi:hypothetical protein